jgi:hypothetical protein
MILVLHRSPLGKLFNYKDEVKEKIINVEGKLIIKEYPTKSASARTLEYASWRSSAKRAVEPDMIIVDYADLLKTRRELGSRLKSYVTA